jgi:peptidoglycan/xylan/chitin deacetylase (PgdA/CDA1 family)
MLRLRQDTFLFPKGRKKALTLSYDDGITQDERLIALMKQYQIKGTFNLNPGLMGDRDHLIQPGIDVSHYKFKKEEICRIYASQEIAVHSMTHPDLARVPQNMAAYEIAECRKELEELIYTPVTGMAYPFGTYNQNVKDAAKSCGITYSRTTCSTHRFNLPSDFLEWHPTCHHTEGCLFDLLEEFIKPADDTFPHSPLLFYVWGHSYEFDAYQQWNDIEKFLKTASEKKDVWYATNGEICEYINSVKHLVYSASGDYIYNPSCLDVWMLIDRKVYCIRSGQTVIIETS